MGFTAALFVAPLVIIWAIGAINSVKGGSQ